MRLSIEIELCSETCFSGSGGGRIGGVDTDLETDSVSGLPIIRGRTIKGLLIEELALILRTLENDQHGPWHRIAADLFGTPGQVGSAKLNFHDAQLPADLCTQVHRLQLLKKIDIAEIREALSTVRFQTKMDTNRGTPEPHSLRSTRLLCAGFTFRAPMYAHEPLQLDEKALLAACAQAVRHAGLQRNHGWGEVRLRLLDDKSVDVTAAWLIGIRQTLETRLDSSTSQCTEAQSPPVPTPRGRVLTYRLTLTTPVVLSTTGNDTSTVETRSYISGSAILGAMAWRWIATQSDQDWAIHPAFKRYFLDASVKWLNAYPEGAYESRLLPRPSSLVQRKQDLGSEPLAVFDKASLDFPDIIDEEPDTQWPALEERFGFVRLELEDEYAGKLSGRQTAWTARLHHTRDNREAGRPIDGSMFSYISLDARERFVGHVLCECEGDADTLRTLLTEGPIALGRSRTASYGGWGEIEILSERPGEDWREFDPRKEFSEKKEEGKGRLVVTLLSDYLGVSKSGLADPRAIEDDLKEALGIDLTPSLRFLSMRPVAGYVSHWKMPRPTHPALSAGSVLVYENVRVDPARLDQLSWDGLGIRRAEGFGRVAVQWHGAAKLRASEESDLSIGPIAELDTASPELFFLRRKLLMNSLRRTLAFRGATDATIVDPLPSASLVGRLRARIRTAISAQELIDFINRASVRSDDKGLKKAGQSLARAHFGRKSLSVWLVERIGGGIDDSIPNWTQFDEVTKECERLAIRLDVLSEEEHWVLLQTYLDAFCERLRRRSITQRARV